MYFVRISLQNQKFHSRSLKYFHDAVVVRISFQLSLEFLSRNTSNSPTTELMSSIARIIFTLW